MPTLTRLSLLPVGSYLLVAVVAIVLLGLLFITPSHRKTTARRRKILAAIRVAVILLVIAAMLRPTLVYTAIQQQAATLILLLDQSRSMEVEDEGSESRWQRLQESIKASSAPLARLSEKLEVQLVGFDNELHPLEYQDGEWQLPEQATGEQTAIGWALDEVLRRESGKRLVGIVLLGDGNLKALPPRDQEPQSAVRRLRDIGCPMHTVTYGGSDNQSQSRDIEVSDMFANRSVFVKNELVVGGTIQVHGYPNQSIPVQLLFETSPGTMEVVATTTVRVPRDGPVPVELSYVPEMPGEFKVTLKAVPQKDELVTINNERSTFVTVLKGGIRVLYLEGAFRVEQKFIRKSLDASPDINVEYVRLDAQSPERRPAGLIEDFQPGKFDVYLIGDLDAKAFSEEDLKTLQETVNRGAGLMMLGGLHSFGPGGYATTPLASVLPIEMDPRERQQFGEPIRTDVHWDGDLAMRPVTQGAGAQVARSIALLAPENQNVAFWLSLPPLKGANRFRDTKGTTLIETQGKVPLLVAGNYGVGRTMAFAGDSTWRWWTHGQGEAHRRFWRQVILWLARKDESQDGQVWVRVVDQRRFRVGSRVTFEAGANGPAGEPLPNALFNAELVLPDGNRQTLPLSRSGDHMLGALANTQQPGDYRIEVEAIDNNEVVGKASARFLVYEQDLELERPAADLTAMRQWADITEGMAIRPDELPDLLEKLEEVPAELEVEIPTKASLWDNWLFFVLFGGLICTEWFLRKRWGLA